MYSTQVTIQDVNFDLNVDTSTKKKRKGFVTGLIEVLNPGTPFKVHQKNSPIINAGPATSKPMNTLAMAELRDRLSA